MMSELRTVIKQSSHYLIARILVMAAGFVSFVILTRIFTVSDYGVLGLLNTTLFMLVILGKCGIPSSTVRFYEEYKLRNQLSTFFSTLFFSSFFFLIIVSLFSLLIIRLFLQTIFQPSLLSLLSLISILTFFSGMADILFSFLRAEQKSAFLSLLSIVRRYSTLTIGILMVLIWRRELYAFYLGFTAPVLILIFYLFFSYSSTYTIAIKNFSTQLFKLSTKYGFPLIWTELSHHILNYVDRFIIQFYLGSSALGLYVAGYNLSSYATEFLVYPLSYVITPVYMNILVNKGEKATQDFFSDLFRYFLLILIPAALGFIAIRKELIGILAPQKYIDAYTIVPYVVLGHSIYATQIILNAGLYIMKKTYIVSALLIAACLFNVILNYFLIPINGYIGAAQATLITYLVYTCFVTFFAFRLFPFSIKYYNILSYIFTGFVMYFSITYIKFSSHIVTLFVKISVGSIVYVLLVTCLDKEVRDKFIKLTFHTVPSLLRHM